MVANHQKHKVGRNLLRAPGFDVAHVHILIGDFGHFRIEVRFDLALLHPVFSVRHNPVLRRFVEAVVLVHHRHLAAVAVQVQRRFDGRVGSAHHHRAGECILIRFVVVVRDVRQVLARHAHLARNVVVTNGQNHLLGAVLALVGLHHKQIFLPVDVAHLGIDVHVEFEILRHLAVVLQRFHATGPEVK